MASGEEFRSHRDWVHEGIKLLDGQTGSDTIERLQPQWDLPDTVAITADIGHYYTAEEVIEESLASLDAGASALHLHILDEDRNETGDIEIWDWVISEIRDKEPNVVIDAGLRGDNFEEKMDHLRQGFHDIVPVLASLDPEYGQQQLAVMKEVGGMRPAFSGKGSNILRIKAHYLDSDDLTRPITWICGGGNPYRNDPKPDPISMARGLTQQIELIRDVDPGGRISVIGGGRASIFLAAQAMIFGCDVRGGVGESNWRYPHSDEKIQRTHHMIDDMVSIAEGLGRKPLSPKEYREELGIGQR